MQNDDLKKILDFSHILHSVKNILRFKGMPGWEETTIDRWDSVAEHCFRLAILVVLLAPRLKEKISVERALKMALAHDLVEIYAEDFHPIQSHNGAGGHAFNQDAYEEKIKRERDAAQRLFSHLPEQEQAEFHDLWEDYARTKLDPANASPEGRLVYGLDKLEAAIQIVDYAPGFSNWVSTERSREYTTKWASYDAVLNEFNDLVQSEMDKKAGRL